MSISETSSSKEEFEVEAIVNDRIKKTYDKKTKTYRETKEYLIKWAGYKRRTWEPIENLDNCREMLLKYLMEKSNNSGKKKNKSLKSPKKFESINTTKNQKNINSPNKEKKSPFLKCLPDCDIKNEKNEHENDEEDFEDDKSNLSFKLSIKKKNKKKNNNSNNNKCLKNKSKEKYDDIDVDIEDAISGNESPFSNKTNMNTKNEFYSESSFEQMNNLEQYYNNSKLLNNNLEKKRKRSCDTFSDISISIEDPFMKTENTSQNYSNNNQINNKGNINFMGISQISIPKTENEKISLLYKIKNYNKKMLFKGTSANTNIPKEEIIKYYEKVLINYLGGKTINFQ